VGDDDGSADDDDVEKDEFLCERSIDRFQIIKEQNNTKSCLCENNRINLQATT
jgi:hypothetical protein